MNENDYKKKYLKYKTKYLKLKKLNQEGSGFIDKAFGIAKHIPVYGSIISTAQSQFNNFSAVAGPQLEMIELLKKFATPQNSVLLTKLIASFATHLTDPTFYPMIISIGKDIAFLMGSAATANPLFVMLRLNSTLGTLKSTFPKEFVLLKEFFVSNRHIIIPVLKKYNPMLVNDASYSFLVDFIFN